MSILFGSHGTPVTPTDLAALPAPPSLGPRHHPVSHFTCLSLVRRYLAPCGLTPVSDGEHFLSESGASYIGAIPVVHTPTASLPALPNHTFSVVIRNSVNQSRALSVLFGLNLRLCSNGVVFGDVTSSVRRKHTIPSDDPTPVLSALLIPVLQSYETVLTRHFSWESSLRTCEVSPAQASDICVRAVRASVISSSDIIPVLDFFSSPSSMLAPSFSGDSSDALSYYAPTSSFCLYNAFTARLRDVSSPLSLPSRCASLLPLLPSSPLPS